MRNIWFYYSTSETIKELHSQQVDRSLIFDTEVDAIRGCISMHKERIGWHRKQIENWYDKIWLQGMETDPKDDDLYSGLTRAAMLLRRKALGAFSEYGVSPEWWEILQHLDERSGTTQRELIKATLKDKGTLSRTLARMLRDGLVEHRLRNKRYGAFFLTPKGLKILEMLPMVLRKLTNDSLASFKPGERTELLGALKRLHTFLAQK